MICVKKYVLKVAINGGKIYYLVMVITSEQIRAALGAMNWSRRMLAEESGVTPRTIQRMAEGCGVPVSSARSLALVVNALEKGDDNGRIEFINSGAPGLRFHKGENRD